MNPLVSIIVPVYNVESYISDCINSIANQTERNFELILIDDESQDRSIEISRKFTHRIPIMRIHAQSNRGLGGARNTGINLARGRFITFVDSDDTISPDYLSAMLDKQQESDYDVVTGKMQMVSETGETLPQRSNAAPSIISSLNEYEQILGVFGLSVSCGRLFRSSIFQSTGIRFPERLPHEDMFFTYKIMQNCAGNSACVERPLYNWRQRNGSLSNSLSLNHIGVMASLREDTERFLRGINAPARDYALAARRNITLLNVFRGKVDRLNPAILEEYLSAVRDQKSEIQKDLERLVQHGIPLSYKTEKILDEATAAQPSMHRKQAEKLDFVFMPMRRYHISDCLPVATLLRKQGFSVEIVSTDNLRDGGQEVTKFAEEQKVEIKHFHDFLESAPRVRTMVFWNDWEPLMRLIADACRLSGTETIGWVEGIQDYRELDMKPGRIRSPYLRSRHVLLPGAFDQRYFQSTGQSLHIGEVVRIQNSWNAGQTARMVQGQKARALINCNFSYGVLEESRDKWLTEAVNACLRSGFIPVISRHPFDTGRLFPEYSSDLDFETIALGCDVSIQRFASGILECLALGKPVIYFNSHGEKVDKFSNPMGAYLLATTQAEIEKLLEERSFFWDRKKAENFLALHCGLKAVNTLPGETIAKVLAKVARTSTLPVQSLVTQLEFLRKTDMSKLRDKGSVIPPFFVESPVTRNGEDCVSQIAGGLHELHPSASLRTSQAINNVLDLTALAAELLIDPISARARLQDEAAAVTQALAALPEESPVREHFERARAFAEAE
ncbi:glycosyltransferase family 2 protein [Paracoccus sanguinis]|uniref:glycosyltransferase family 2 protein n=1 Tax=Paracoccus sanguinis TaxID=1545044 RepID=UPI000B28720D|nr:glycosyltransferase family 2 protein [Paracoccus sanguinis]